MASPNYINLQQFHAELEEFIGTDGVLRLLRTLHRAGTWEVFRRLVLRSPVDTGRFRANWHINDGAPKIVVRDFDFGGDREANKGAATQEAIDREADKVNRLVAPGVTYVANNLPYAVRLNQGWSQQAPAGFVELTLEEVRRHLAVAVKSYVL